MDAGALGLLQAEIDRLRAENDSLKSKMNSSNMKAVDMTDMQTRISELEQDLNAKLQNAKPVQQMKKLLGRKNDELKLLRQRIAQCVQPLFLDFSLLLLDSTRRSIYHSLEKKKTPNKMRVPDDPWIYSFSSDSYKRALVFLKNVRTTNTCNTLMLIISKLSTTEK